MKVEGLCLAWAPRIEIVRELAAAGSSEQRTEILVRSKVEIVADIKLVLTEIEHPDLALHVEAGLQAISAYADGHTAAAQSLTATAISDLVSGPLKAKSFNQALKTFRAADPLHGVGMRDFPLYAVGWALAYALERYDDAGGGFNRNKTLHWLGPHYNEANLLMSLRLLAGFISELELLLGRRERRQLAETTA